MNVVNILSRESFPGHDAVVGRFHAALLLQIVDIWIRPGCENLANVHQLPVAVENLPRRFWRDGDAARLADIGRMAWRPSSKVEATQRFVVGCEELAELRFVQPDVGRSLLRR